MKACVCISFILFSVTSDLVSATITLRFQTYPDIQQELKQLTHPTTLSRNTLDSITKHSLITGIFVTYAGFLEASNADGYVIFPRKHTEPTISVLISKHITPIVMFEQTVQHWQVPPAISYALYTFQQQKDEETDLTYWQVSSSLLPEDRNIPLETVIIITDPSYIVIPDGVSVSYEGQNLLLPTIYVRKEIPIIENSLYILQLAHLFRPAHVLHTKKETYHALQLHE